jgi:hypothetical protein
MSTSSVTSETFGREVLGPIFAEFCLRLWSLQSLLQRPEEVALLFCSRGGLRMQFAYERFLQAMGLPASVHSAPLMVSRLAAIRPALLRTVDEQLESLVPAAARTLSYEMRHASLSEVAIAITGIAPDPSDGRWDAPFSTRGFAVLLRHPDSRSVVALLAQQSRLFLRHLASQQGGRPRAVLVDTGLFGTTAHLLADAQPDLEFSLALIARSNYRREPTPLPSNVFGISLQVDGYSPLQRRTAMLRYWQFTEALFEPELPSVSTFTEEQGILRSNLEVEGWQDQIPPRPGSAYAGLVSYLDVLSPKSGEQVLRDTTAAWNRFWRAVVWPDRDHGYALRSGLRSRDFGSDMTFTDGEWRGSIAALRGSSMWREGEIARSGSPLRLPLLAAIETVYGARRVKHAISSARRLLP